MAPTQTPALPLRTQVQIINPLSSFCGLTGPILRYDESHTFIRLTAAHFGTLHVPFTADEYTPLPREDQPHDD